MSKRILIVDDDPDLREATEIVLSSAGYEVASAASAAEGLKAIAAKKPDLILLDVMMETDTEGFHMAYQLKEDPATKNIPIVILTCIEEKTGEVLDPDKAGDFLPVQAFLRKPLDAATLKGKVAELLK